MILKKFILPLTAFDIAKRREREEREREREREREIVCRQAEGAHTLTTKSSVVLSSIHISAFLFSKISPCLWFISLCP